MASARWPGEPGSPERKAAMQADREARAERARELYPDDPRKARAVARGHPEDAPGAIGARQLRQMRGARSIYMPPAVRQPDGTTRQPVVWKDREGRNRSAYLPPGTDATDLVELWTAEADFPEPEDT